MSESQPNIPVNRLRKYGLGDTPEPSLIPTEIHGRKELIKAIERLTDPTGALVTLCMNTLNAHREQCDENDDGDNILSFTVRNEHQVEKDEGFLARRFIENRPHTMENLQKLIIAFKNADFGIIGSGHLEYHFKKENSREAAHWRRIIWVDVQEAQGVKMAKSEVLRILKIMEQAEFPPIADHPPK